jgi:hypothetical protein
VRNKRSVLVPFFRSFTKIVTNSVSTSACSPLKEKDDTGLRKDTQRKQSNIHLHTSARSARKKANKSNRASERKETRQKLWQRMQKQQQQHQRSPQLDSFQARQFNFPICATESTCTTCNATGHWLTLMWPCTEHASACVPHKLQTVSIACTD